MKIIPIAALESNYIWSLEAGRECVIVDPGEAEPVLAYLHTQGLRLIAVLITHRHRDHTGGIEALVARHPCPVYGPAWDQIAGITQTLGEGESVNLLGCEWQVLAIPGHTEEHIAYFSKSVPLDIPASVTPALTASEFKPASVCFVGDTLFAGGCGNRLLEAEVMYQSLKRLAALPPTTWLYCGHEYTQTNLRFALDMEPHNAATHARYALTLEQRRQGLPTVPSQLCDELATNPFLRVDEPAVIARLATLSPGCADESSAARFAVMRRAKDSFR